MRLGILAFGALAAACHMEAGVTAPAKPDCEAEFANVMNDGFYPDLSSKTKRWEALAPHCAGTGLYETRLSAFYILAGDNGKARNVLQQGLSRKTAHERDLRLALFDIDLSERPLQAMEVEADALIKDYPEWWGGYRALGQIRLVQRRFPEAIDNLERANTLGSSSGAYTVLAMAYYQANRYRESAVAMQRALKLDQDALRHTQAVCATAYSLVAIGQLAAADDLLVKHLKVEPAARNDPTYQQAVSIVEKKMQELGPAK